MICIINACIQIHKTVSILTPIKRWWRMIYLWCLCGSVSLAVLIAVYCMLDWGCLGGRRRAWLGRGLLEVGVGGGGDGRHRAGGAVLATNIWKKKKYNSLFKCFVSMHILQYRRVFGPFHEMSKRE